MDWYFAPWEDMWNSFVGKIWISSIMWLMVLGGAIQVLRWGIKVFIWIGNRNNE